MALLTGTSMALGGQGLCNGQGPDIKVLFDFSSSCYPHFFVLGGGGSHRLRPAVVLAIYLIIGRIQWAGPDGAGSVPALHSLLTCP